MSPANQMARVARATAVVLATSAAASIAGSPAVAAAGPTAATRLAGATNDARADHRLHRYGVASDLSSVARRWAAHMAATHTLAHNPRLAREVRGWCELAENVGVGTSVARIQGAFMRSTSHRDNILSRDFVQVGVGTARDASGRLWVDVIFRRPS